MKEYLHYTTTASTPLSAYKQGINMELHKAFENWVDEQGVIDYCKKNYSFIYDTATNTLNSAVKKGWLQRDDNASPKKYKLT
ncbi:hypothetical protein SAMN05660841_03711 [Sphingobacterium nematocida]|uniref:Uncharacterized protein n=1 Tax=Sphingobacterium nematocida TaxID=1513896 RepID=A0A1T5G2W3_9SPHI|nr:hypothetical protein [Sphingobacterium nematocida]SKC02786.1 hypothetical protein SAMN05660841_03711 [Sphingobacterium nematocida]